MDIKKLNIKIPDFIKKYKFVLLILLIGIALMLIPGTKKTESKENTIESIVQKENTTQKELESILEMIYGAGKVKVMLQERSGEEKIYQVNEDTSSSDTSSKKEIDTIILTDSNRNEVGLIKQINPPQYLGAVILCQGADDPAVKLSITNAVSKITGLGADKIAVLKMK